MGKETEVVLEVKVTVATAVVDTKVSAGALREAPMGVANVVAKVVQTALAVVAVVVVLAAVTVVASRAAAVMA